MEKEDVVVLSKIEYDELMNKLKILEEENQILKKIDK